MRKWIRSFLRKRILVIARADAEVDQPGVALAHALWNSDGFRRLLGQIVSEQSVKDALYLRDCVRGGRQADATRVEARLEIFELLPDIFEEVAARYKVDRAQ